jgi:phosphatidylserine/phosphatidylglycerophosphate/cardiolipin synthase-like enzyme
MKQLSPNLRNFLLTGAGFTLSLLAGGLFIALLAQLDVGAWLLNLIDETQVFQKILALPLIAGLLLALGGFVIGGGGGWILASILGTTKRLRVLIGSGVAFALTTSLLMLVFLLVTAFLGLYNNLTTNPISQYGILFGLYGLVFGLVVGVLLALMTVHIRHSWRVVLASVAGFILGGVVMGILLKLVNPTAGYQTHPILTTIVLLLALAAPIFFGGGALGIAYGQIRRRSEAAQKAVETTQNPTWQAVVVGLTGAVVAFWFISLLGTISSFLEIDPADLQSQLTLQTVGVAWSEAQATDLTPGSPDLPAAGTDPVQITGPDQQVHMAWCSATGFIEYQAGSQPVEQISFPGCQAAPVLAFGQDGRAHLAWYTNEIQDTNGVNRPASLLVESIRLESGWSDPAIAAEADEPEYLALAADEVGNLRLAWASANQDPRAAIQETYQCSPEDLSQLQQAVLNTIVSGNFYPAGTEIPFCRNQYQRIIYTPNPQPVYSDDPETPNGGFDRVASLADEAEYEVLFATMQYEPNTSPPSPGSTLTEEISSLYEQVKASPQDYPRGMTVRILLGNYPEMSDFTWGTQIVDVITDLRAAGVDKMVDPEIGWRLEVANFAGTYPHSHTKFIVIDGRIIAGVGFNYGYLHLPLDHPSGRGYDMLDLGLQVTGPAAQPAISVYDDMWEGADQVHCDSLSLEDENWVNTCQELKATASHVPEVLRTYLPQDGSSNSFSLYRSQVYKEVDTALAAALANAQETIDLLHVNFSLELICMANLVFPDLCTIENALPYMDAMLDAIEQNGARVRVIMENTNSNGLENRVAAEVFMEELAKRGLEDQVEFRFYNGKLHAKATLIDDELLAIGSHNMHYSSWGEAGLTEFVITTDDPQAIEEFKGLYETKWAEAIPYDEATYTTSP